LTVFLSVEKLSVAVRTVNCSNQRHSDALNIILRGLLVRIPKARGTDYVVIFIHLDLLCFVIIYLAD